MGAGQHRLAVGARYDGTQTPLGAEDARFAASPARSSEDAFSEGSRDDGYWPPGLSWST